MRNQKFSAPLSPSEETTSVKIRFPTVEGSVQRPFYALMAGFGVRQSGMTNCSLTAHGVSPALVDRLTKAVEKVATQYRCECQCCKGWVSLNG